MFQTACGLREKGGWEIAPSEFWNMTPGDWWQIYDINIGYALKEKLDTDDRLLRLLKQGIKENQQRKKA